MSRLTALLTWVLLFFSLGASYANNQLPKKSRSGVTALSLSDALQLVSKSHDVRFIYERSLLQSIVVTVDENYIRHSQLDQVMDVLLKPNELVYKPVNKKYFMIMKKNDDRINRETLTPTDTIKPASKDARGSLSGEVLERASGKPIPGAVVQLPQYGLFSVTNTKGVYSFQHVPLNKTRIQIQSISMLSIDQEITIGEGSNTIDFKMETNALDLKAVLVVAKESKAGQATSSTISRTAIDHLQATSLGDVLQLLPGAVVNNPTFSGATKALIRELPSSASATANNMGSLGTSIIVNGAPISNNANLQAFNTSTDGTKAGFSTSSGAGMDLRQFSADNIESVEVIRGIPTVEYGDLTAGAINIKTKAGKEPLSITARINPRLTQVAVGKGVDLGEKAGSVYANMEYTNTFDDQRYEYKGYNRVTGNLMYSKKFFKKTPLYTTTSFSYAKNLDDEKTDPNDKRFMQKRKAQDINYRFNTSGKLSLQKKFARSLNYDIAVSYSVQKGFQQELLGGYIYPLSYAMENVTQPGQFVPSEYLSQLTVEGKPLNVFAKLTDQFFIKTGSVAHKFLVGAEWRMDANYGAGRIYDPARPPRMQGGHSIRPLNYNDIPAMKIFSLYAEDVINTTVFNRRFTLQAGVRFDNVQPQGLFSGEFGTVLAPRTNMSYEIVKNFSIRAGYGIAAKAPTLLYMYPQNAYYDLINFNHYAENPNERLVVLTTKVFDVQNRDLRIATNEKKEIGFDWKFAQNKRLTVTGFHEKVKNGYSFTTTLGSVSMVPVEQYGIQSQQPGQPPVLNPVPVSIDTFIADYSTAANNRLNINKGIELDLDLGRFDAFRTSVVLNGAWINSRSMNNGHLILKQQLAGKDPSKVAVFKGTGSEAERISTTLRLIHNIPELRFVVTFSAQTIWSDKDKNIGVDSIPSGYISRKTGDVTWLSASEKAQITSADKELFNLVSKETFITESWKPSWLFNLRLTKEINRNIGFSFYANNVFMNRPLVQSTRFANRYEKRNIALFFGTELSIKL